MEHSKESQPRWIRFFKALNYRVIKTSCLKATIYFILAVAIFLAACYLFTHMPTVM